MNYTNLFKMVRSRSKVRRGPSRVAISVVSHRELLNHDSNQPCTCSFSFFSLGQAFPNFGHQLIDLSRVVNIEQHFPMRTAYSPPCCINRISSLLLFLSTTSAREPRDIGGETFLFLISLYRYLWSLLDCHNVCFITSRKLPWFLCQPCPVL